MNVADMAAVMHSRICNLTREEMQYANAIYHICSGSKRNPKNMTEICDHLYLGSFDDAENIEKLKEESITYVVNTVEDEFENMKTGKEFYGENFKYLGFLSEDIDTYPILKHFDQVFTFIEEARKNNSKCLIHCMAGINRSGCLATAYYMVFKGIGPISAADHVFHARGTLLSNTGFIERLVRFSNDRNLLRLDEEKIMKNGKAT